MMSVDSILINKFLNFIDENKESESRVYSKSTLQNLYLSFLEFNSETEHVPFSLFQLNLKHFNRFKSIGRESYLRTDDQNLPVNGEKKWSVPEFAEDCHFFLVEANDFDTIQTSMKTGLFTFKVESASTFNSAFELADQVVMFATIPNSNKIYGFFTMDNVIIDSETSDTEIANHLQLDEWYCPVTWEVVRTISSSNDLEIEVPIDPSSAREICQKFYTSEKNTKVSGCEINVTEHEFKSTEDIHYSVDSERKKDEKDFLSPLLICNEAHEMKAEGFRKRSLEKKQAARHYDMPPRKTGVVVKFSQQKGYGFIRPDYDAIFDKQLPDIFVHRTSIVSSNKVPNLRVGQKTEYDVTLDPRTGKPHAVNVTGPGRSSLDDKNNNTERNTRYNTTHNGWNPNMDSDNNRLNKNWQNNNNNNHWDGHHYENTSSLPFENSRQSYYPSTHNPYSFNKSKQHLSSDPSMHGNLRDYNNHYVTSPRYDNTHDYGRYQDNQQVEYDDYSRREYWRYENEMHYPQLQHDYNQQNYNNYRSYDSSNRNNFGQR